jgi:hypothetical protein
MFPANDGMPTPIGRLDDLLTTGDTSATPFKTFIGHNLGNRSLLMYVPMHEFYRISDVANERGKNGEPVAQRKLDPAHAQKLAVFTLKGLLSAAELRRRIKGEAISPTMITTLDRMGRQPYMSFQPIVTNLRTCEPGGSNLAGSRMVTQTDETAGFKVMLSQKDVLWVVDGQHRRKAMQLVFEFLDHVRAAHAYPKKGSLYVPSDNSELSPEELQVWQECFEVARGYCTIAVEVHLGLGVDEERQLFHDLNNLAKKVETSLALQFDRSNPVNLFITEVLIDDILDWEIMEKDIVNWQSDTGAFPRKDLVAVNAILFLNKTNISGATPPLVEPKKEVAARFWSTVKTIPHLGQAGARIETVAAQPVVLKALAKLTYDFAFSKRRDSESDGNLERLLSGIGDLDFSHENPMWRYYELTAEERSAAGLNSLAEYLPSDDEGKNRDIGAYDGVAGVMRFGAKHNDIFPILGDMVRWKLGLPNRNPKQAAIAA